MLYSISIRIASSLLASFLAMTMLFFSEWGKVRVGGRAANSHLSHFTKLSMSLRVFILEPRKKY